MHDSLLAYICFQHASCLLLYIVAWCPWFIYGYVVCRLVIIVKIVNVSIAI